MHLSTQSGAMILHMLPAAMPATAACSPGEVTACFLHALQTLVYVPLSAVRKQIALHVGQQEVFQVCCGNVIYFFVGG